MPYLVNKRVTKQVAERSTYSVNRRDTGIGNLNVIQFQTVCTVGDTFDPVITVGAGCPYTPVWDFGDGTTATGLNPTKNTYTDAGPHTVTLTILDIATWLTSITVNDDKISGDFLGALSGCDALTSIRAEENLLLVSDIASLSVLTALTSVILGDRSGVYGDLADLATLTSLTTLVLSGTQIESDIAGLSTMTQLTHLDLHSNVAGGAYGDITGNLSDLSGLINLTYLSVAQTRIAGELTDISAMVNLGALLGYHMSVAPAELSGSFADILGLTKLAYVYVSDCQITGGTMAHNPYFEYGIVRDLGWNETTVDAFLAALYANRATYTRTAYGARHTLQIHGTNAAPSGVYQDDPTPSTGLEYVYKLANDPDAEGFVQWNITYTGGVAP